MDEAVLTMIDTAGIQGYVFGSNRLRENVGASYLVELATKAWVFKALDKLGAHNLPKAENDKHDLKRRPDPALQMEDGKLCAELLYAGGGNAQQRQGAIKTYPVEGWLPFRFVPIAL